MAPYPFQRFPSLGEYCAWALTEGFIVECKQNGAGHFRRITSPDGSRRVDQAELDPDERMTPRLLHILDSRLGVESPWLR